MRFSPPASLSTATFIVLAASAVAAPADASSTARALADSAPDPALRAELQQAVAEVYARRSDRETALALATVLPPAQRAPVLLTLAAHLPDPRGKEAEQLALDAQTARALTTDWHKARISRLLAVAYARLGKFEAAIALAHTVPDTEDKAFAQQDVVAALNRAGEVARARELAGAIEENRRYGTYRQKAAALADCARTLYLRGNAEDATTLLAQAELLLPKKPGWSDGGAYRDVAVAAHACGEKDRAHALLTRTEALARQIAGPWRVAELVSVADAWRACGDAPRAAAGLREAADFLATLAPLERAEQAVALARGWSAEGEPAKARAALGAVLAEADAAGRTEAWRKPRVMALLAEAELVQR
jgi:hypothetical protein